MAYILPTNSGSHEDIPNLTLEEPRREPLTDLRVFWGPDICRLEYLIHLVETGRIKDEAAEPDR